MRLRGNPSKIFLNVTSMYLTLSPGKVLIIGGGIANFTNVAATFKVHVWVTLKVAGKLEVHIYTYA